MPLKVMIKSNLFRPQTKPPSRQPFKSVSLANVAQQLQSTSISDDVSIGGLAGYAKSTVFNKPGSSAPNGIVRHEIVDSCEQTDESLSTSQVLDPTGAGFKKQAPVRSISTEASNAERSLSLSEMAKLIVPTEQDAKPELDQKAAASIAQLPGEKVEPSVPVCRPIDPNYSASRTPVHEKWAAHVTPAVQGCNPRRKARRNLPLEAWQMSVKTVALPSAFGQTLCFNTRHCNGLLTHHDGRKIRPTRHRLSYARQMSKCSASGQLTVMDQGVFGSRIEEIKEFDFCTPSPDDVVVNMQKKAFSN